MSILIDEKTRVIVQGVTGRDGAFHAVRMKQDGTNIVGGVTPGKGGQTVHDIPVFNSVAEARSATDANASIIFVPAKFASSAIREASDAEIKLIICITEGIPVLDMVEIYHLVKSRKQILIGPNCPGLISPGKCKMGIMPAFIHKAGNIGVISRSGTLTYEVVYALSCAGMGQSTCIGVGGDPVIGAGYIDLLSIFDSDPDTKGVVLIGEIGGDAEERAADYIQKNIKIPVVSFICGRSAPKDKRMGHAGAIISGGLGTAEAKVSALESAGVAVAEIPSAIPELLAAVL